MPRRPSKKAGNKKGPRPTKRSDASIKRWNKLSDIPMDEEDQFHASRDRILLEGEEERYEDNEDEDEVFALKGVNESSEEEDDDENEDMEALDDNDVTTSASTTKLPKSKSQSKSKKPAMAAPDKEDVEEEEEEEEESWGRKKSAYYASNADQIESDDEEANEMEEQEARRLQAKASDTLQDDDFGLANAHPDTAVDVDILDEQREGQAASEPTLPADKRSLLRHLEKTNPEALALARDWEDVAWNIVKTQQKLEKMEADPAQDKLGLGMIHLHYQALLTYGTTLAFYLHLRASPRYAANPTLLRQHPILRRLLTLKQSLATLEELDFALSDEEEDSQREDLSDTESELEGFDDEDVENEVDEVEIIGPTANGKRKKKALERGELEALLMDAESDWDRHPSASSAKVNGSHTNGIKTKANLMSNGVTPEPPKKKRKTTASAPKSGFDLVEPTFAPSTAPAPSMDGMHERDVDAFGEPSALAAADAQDKRARRRSLAFYTAKLEGAEARRAGARVAAAGGDDDIPYRARDRRGKDGQKGAKAHGADLDAEEPKVREDHGKEKKRRREEDGEDEVEAEPEEDGYYSLVKRKAKEQKEQKKAEYEAARAATRINEDEEEANGPRGVSRAILKNKGLTPHRAKSVRNPRVKKRMRFDKAQKTIRSQKAVFKQGVDASRYEGERSGISKVVKSVRL